MKSFLTGMSCGETNSQVACTIWREAQRYQQMDCYGNQWEETRSMYKFSLLLPMAKSSQDPSLATVHIYGFTANVIRPKLIQHCYRRIHVMKHSTHAK
jgi:hypothetical protein